MYSDMGPKSIYIGLVVNFIKEMTPKGCCAVNVTFFSGAECTKGEKFILTRYVVS